MINTLTNTTESTSTTTGALKISGGLGIVKDVYVGGVLNSGNHVITGTLSSSGAATLTTSCSIGTTLSVTGASTFTATSRHNDGLTMPCDGTAGTPIWFEDCSGSAANHHWYLNGALKCYFTNGGVWVTVSDRRLKSNIKPLTNMLDAVCRTIPCIYNKHHKVDDEFGYCTEIGFIAQEIADIPELSSFVSTGGRDNELMGINYTGLIVPAFQAIKELTARLEIIEKELWKVRQTCLPTY